MDVAADLIADRRRLGRSMSVRSIFANRMTRQPALTRAFLDCQDELLNFFAGRLKCPETARDLSQEVYLRLERIEDPRAVNNHRSFIFRIARNLLIDHVRNETRRSALLAEAGTISWDAPERPSPEQTSIARDELDVLRRAISGLPARTRRIFHAHRFDGKTRREIADELGVSPTTVENHIRRALEHFARALDDSD